MLIKGGVVMAHDINSDRTFVGVLRPYAIWGTCIAVLLWLCQFLAAYFFTVEQMTNYGFNGELIQESAKLILLFPYMGLGFFGAILFGIIYETCPFVERD